MSNDIQVYRQNITKQWGQFGVNTKLFNYSTKKFTAKSQQQLNISAGLNTLPYQISAAQDLSLSLRTFKILIGFWHYKAIIHIYNLWY